MSPPIVAITFPAAPGTGTTLRTTDGIDWRIYGPFLRPGVFCGSVDGEHGVGCQEFPPGTRITAEALNPDCPLDAAFWERVRRWREKCDALRSRKEKPPV